MSNTQRKQAKRKAKQKKMKASQPQCKGGEAAYIRAGIKQEVYDCQIYDNIPCGMATVSLYKEATPGIIVVGSFNIDMYCLGIKNAFIKAGTYQQYMDLKNNPMLTPCKPEDAKKLIENAVEYAGRLGFKPHKDFAKAFRIFDNVDSSTSVRKYTFGKDGKPFFIGGPHDSPRRSLQIMQTLEKSVGKDNFNVMMPDAASEVLDEKAGEWEANRRLFK